MRLQNLSIAAAVFVVPALISFPALADEPNIVLVHGLSVDGSSWRPVDDILAGHPQTVANVIFEAAQARN